MGGDDGRVHFGQGGGGRWRELMVEALVVDDLVGGDIVVVGRIR